MPPRPIGSRISYPLETSGLTNGPASPIPAPIANVVWPAARTSPIKASLLEPPASLFTQVAQAARWSSIVAASGSGTSPRPKASSSSAVGCVTFIVLAALNCDGAYIRGSFCKSRERPDPVGKGPIISL